MPDTRLSCECPAYRSHFGANGGLFCSAGSIRPVGEECELKAQFVQPSHRGVGLTAIEPPSPPSTKPSMVARLSACSEVLKAASDTLQGTTAKILRCRPSEQEVLAIRRMPHKSGNACIEAPDAQEPASSLFCCPTMTL